MELLLALTCFATILAFGLLLAILVWIFKKPVKVIPQPGQIYSIPGIPPAVKFQVTSVVHGTDNRKGGLSGILRMYIPGGSKHATVEDEPVNRRIYLGFEFKGKEEKYYFLYSYLDQFFPDYEVTFYLEY